MAHQSILNVCFSQKRTFRSVKTEQIQGPLSANSGHKKCNQPIYQYSYLLGIVFYLLLNILLKISWKSMLNTLAPHRTRDRHIHSSV